MFKFKINNKTFVINENSYFVVDENTKSIFVFVTWESFLEALHEAKVFKQLDRKQLDRKQLVKNLKLLKKEKKYLTKINKKAKIWRCKNGYTC